MRPPLILWAACLGMLTLGANGTAIMSALPTMRAELRLSDAELGWAINAYLVASAACIIVGGKTSDRAGPRRVSAAGLALFAVASVVVATAQLPSVLLVGRALQGLAASLAVPGTLAAVGEANAPRRAAAIGLWAGFLMLGFSVGPLIGGALTHYLGWRSIFWTSGTAMLVAASFFLLAPGAVPTPHLTRPARFDWAGFASLAVFMAALVSALHALPAMRRAPAEFWVPALLAAAAFFMLLVAERRGRHPLVDLALFHETAFVRALMIGAIAMCSILMLLLYYNLYAQSPAGLALTPVGAGLSLLPMSGGLLLVAFAAPLLVGRLGPRRSLSAAMMLTALAAILLAAASATAMRVPLLIGLFGIGMGLALPYATAPRLALSALPPAQAGAGSGIINACTFLGGSVGVAGGAVAFAGGGLPAVMGLIIALALAGLWVCRGLARAP